MAENGDRRAALGAIGSVLAASCACAEQDLLRERVTIVPARELPGRLCFPRWSKPLQVVTMGAGVVVSCHPERLDWLRSNLGQLGRDAVFSAPTIGRLARYVEPDGQYLAGPDLKYACSRAHLRPAASPAGVEIALVEGERIADLYAHEGFGHTLSYRADSPRPDMLATVATRAGEVVGIAGASADSNVLWQIGVEVVAGERGTGIGRALVGRLTMAVLDAGRVPYYSTAASNLRSRAVASGLGYWPAWTELYARDHRRGGPGD